MAYAKIIYAETLPNTLKISLVITAIVLSYLTYKFIESPLRFGGNNKKKVIFLCSIIIIIGGFGFAMRNEKIKVDNNLSTVVEGYNKKCGDLWKNGEICKVGNKISNHKILAVGSSSVH